MLHQTDRWDHGRPDEAQVDGPTDNLSARIAALWSRTSAGQAEQLYYYFQPVDEIEGPWVYVGGERKLMFATYSYLGLLKHPRVVAAAKQALEHYGAGTHGVRILGGTIDLHARLEERIAAYTGREDAIVYSSGYVTNLATISTMVGRGDYVLSDKWNHASIVDGCLLSQGHFRRFRHNDMDDLVRNLSVAPEGVTKLVVADAVFSMDGDILNLPDVVEICRRFGARLMVDEAHSLGVLGATGRGIEEHYGMPGVIDVWMGTLSKTIPGIGGFVAGQTKLVHYLRHVARGFVFSAALPPSVTAGALEAFNVMEEEGAALNQTLRRNVERFIGGLRAAGFDTGNTSTPIVPILVQTDDRAIRMTKYCQDDGVFVLPVLPPAVPEGAARLRANVTAADTFEDIDFALEVFTRAGRSAGVI